MSDVEATTGYFIQEPSWDNSIFSCFFNQKFFACENSKKKLSFFKDRLFEIRQKIPINDLVKDKLFKRILVTYFQSIDQYAKNNFSRKDRSFITELFSVFKEFIMYDDKNYFLNFFLLTVALPVLNLIVQDVPTKEWYKKHLLNTFNFILKQQTKKNRTLYTNMMESNLVLKLLDNLYLSTDICTQFKILETVKLTCWKKELIVDLEYYFPRNKTLQEKFKIFLTTGRDRDFINTFNELNKNIKIYSIMVEKVSLGKKFLNSDDDDFYLDINWASQTMTLFVNPLCFYDSPPALSQDSEGNYKIKYIETICIPFNIIETIDNSYAKRDSKIVYYIDITLNGPCEYELETSKNVVENSRKLKILTKPVLQTQGVILERYFQKYFQEKYKFGIYSVTGRTDCLNINIHKVYSANSSLASEPSTGFLNTITECDNMFVKTKKSLLPVTELTPVVEEDLCNGIQNSNIVTEDIYEHFSVTGNKEKDMEKNKVWTSAEIQINSISSNGITGQSSQENMSDKSSVTYSNKVANAVDDLIYGKHSQISDSVFKMIEKDSPNKSQNKSNSPKVKILTPVDLNERYERLNSQKNTENDEVISNSCSEESFHAKKILQNATDDQSNDGDNNNDINNQNYESDIESVFSTKSIKQHDFMVDTRNILSKRLRTKKQYKYNFDDDPEKSQKNIEGNKRTRKKKNDGYVTDMEDTKPKEEDSSKKSYRKKNKGYVSDTESIISIKSNSDIKDKNKKSRRKSIIDYSDTDCDEIVPKRKYTKKTKKPNDEPKILKVTKTKRMIYSDSENDENISKISKYGSDIKKGDNKKISSNKYVSSDSEKEACRGFESDDELKNIFTSRKNNKKMHEEQSPFFSKNEDVEKNEDSSDNKKNKLNINGTVCNVDLDSQVVRDLKQKQLKVKINVLEPSKIASKKNINKQKSLSLVNVPVTKKDDNKKIDNEKRINQSKISSSVINFPVTKTNFDKVKSKGTKRKLFNPKEETYEALRNDKENISMPKPKTKNKRIVNDDIFNKLKNNEVITSPLKSQRTKTKDIHNKVVMVYESLFGAGDATQSIEGSCPNLSVSPLPPVEMELLHTEVDVDDFEIRADNEEEQNFNSVLFEVTPTKNKNLRKTSTPHNSDFSTNPAYETFAKTLNMQNMKEEKTCSCTKRNGLYSNLYVSSLIFKQSFKDYIMCDNHDAVDDEKIKRRQEIYNDLIQHIDYIMNKIDDEFH